MPIELKIPEVGESITEVEIGAWLKREGEQVQKDEPVVTLESEKATVELPAPESGTITQVLKKKGEVAKVGEVIAYLEKNGQAETAKQAPEKRPTEKAEAPKPEPKAKAPEPRIMPAAQRALAESGLRPEQIEATGPGGRLLKEDVLREVKPKAGTTRQEPEEVKGQRSEVTGQETAKSEPGPKNGATEGREEEVVPMSRLRRTVAERLVEAQRTTALLTTFNEIDMGSVLALRKEQGEAFQQKYNVRLGFMSFFVKACVDALKQFPVVNAEVRDTNIAYHNYYDIGVAVGSGKGGVGKSTIAASLALGLNRAGAKVGLLDADVYGPSIPHLLGLRGQPEREGESKIKAFDCDGMKVISMGFFVPAEEAIG